MTTRLSFFADAMQSQARADALFAEAQANSTQFLIRVCKDAVEEPVEFIDSLLRSAPFILRIVQTMGNQAAQANNNDCEGLSPHMVEVLSTISKETVDKAIVAFAHYRRDLPTFIEAFGLPPGASAADTAARTIAESDDYYKALDPTGQALLKGCKTAEHVVNRFIPYIVAQLQADPSSVETLTQIETGVETRDIRQTPPELTLVITLVPRVMAAVVHLTKLQEQK